MSLALDPLTFPLRGSRLIEASAGTGKTYTIAALYLRLILGHGTEETGYTRPLMPSEILVMTFTRAATRELSERIRDRLLDAARWFRAAASSAEQDWAEFGGTDEDEEWLADDDSTTGLLPEDPLLQGLLAHYDQPQAREQAAWRLDMAAEAMDDAAIYTIDAWCQRTLREYAFLSGVSFDEELTPDESELLLEACRDYWRQHGYALTPDQLEAVQQTWPSFEDLRAQVGKLLPHLPPQSAQYDQPLGRFIQQLLNERQTRLQPLSQGWHARAQNYRAWLDQELADHPEHWNKRSFKLSTYDTLLQQLAEWEHEPIWPQFSVSDSNFQKLTPDGLQALRLKAAPELTVPPVAYELESLGTALQNALDELETFSTELQLHAVHHVAQRLSELKQHARSFSFADLQTRLDQALHGPHGAELRQCLLEQYPVALIDEFQDTSPLQYRLFNTLYRTHDNDLDSALLLIGDPKQSIYRFRGADINSYLQARRATSGRHYVLDTNYRSTHEVVDAVNQWFEQGEAREEGKGAFGYRQDLDNPLPFIAVRAQGRRESLRLGQGAMPALTVQYDLELRSKPERLELDAERCAERIVTWLNDPSVVFQHPEKTEDERLRPADIAILVRDYQEANAIRRALLRRGVASVYLSDRESIFQGQEAQDLLHWLRAVEMPQDSLLVRAALATPTIGLSLEDLAHLAADEAAFDRRSQQFHDLHDVWLNQGVLAMLRRTLHVLGLPARWLRQADGERRLTNYLHLAELLQTAATTLEGEAALVRWLATQIASPAHDSEEQTVRLESDADLVKVVTIHKSKGLEYPIVCLPYACNFRPTEAKDLLYLEEAMADGSKAIRLDIHAADVEQADEDRLREDLRLFYVALTRARHAIWLGFAATKYRAAKQPYNHRTAPGYLLMGPERCSEEALQTQLEVLAEKIGTACVLEAAPTDITTTHFQPHTLSQPLLDSPLYRGNFERNWSLASFSRLVRGAHEGAMLAAADPSASGATSAPEASRPNTALLPTALPRRSEDEDDPQEQSINVPNAPLRRAAAATAAPWHHFPRGTHVGDILHDQMEWLAEEKFQLQDQPALLEHLRQRICWAGFEEQADDAVAWFQAIVANELPHLGSSLAQLTKVLPEMEFWLPAERLNAQEIDTLCRRYLLDDSKRPALPPRQFHGMLMGFADLIFEHEGRYWVLDYKSNYLGPDASAYDAKGLQRAMAHHRYDVQALLYLLALHRLLQARLGEAYDPEEHLGGAVYFFLRGLDGEEAGEYHIALTPERLEALLVLDEQLSATPLE